MLTYHTMHSEGQPALRLTGDLTIYTAAQARRDIPSKMDKHGAQILDLSGVDEMDTAGVQLLLWLKRESADRGVRFSLIHHSPSVLEAFDLLRLAATFGDPILLSPTSS